MKTSTNKIVKLKLTAAICSILISSITNAQTVLKGPTSTGTNVNPVANVALEIRAAAIPQGNSTFEILQQGKVADNTDYYSIQNGTIVDGRFLPVYVGHRVSTLIGGAVSFMGSANSNLDQPGNTVAMVRFMARLNDLNTAGVTPQVKVANTPLFAWENYNATYMQMLANGFLGIGTTLPNGNTVITPTEQLHTTAGVRFAGLVAGGAPTSMVVADVDGKLWRANLPTGNATLTCGNVNFVPKVTAANTMGCSQIFDNGVSVGIGTTNGFIYSGAGGVLGSGALPNAGDVITLRVNGLTQATAFIATSDGRFKKDIKTIENALDKISKLNGVTYNWRSEEFKSKGFNFDDNKQLGFIAQELAKVVPEAVIVNENGYYGVNYNMLIPLLTEAIKEQQQMIATQKSKIEEIEAKLTSNTATSNSDILNDGSAKLYQNTPNPFSQSTTIKYFLPDNAGNASILVFDLSGKLVKTLALNQKGESSVSLNGNEFQAGMYVYSLIINGQEVESKRMIITE